MAEMDEMDEPESTGGGAGAATPPPAEVLCPACGEGSQPLAPGACRACGESLRLHDRFVLDRFLGSGGQGRTYAARDLRDGVAVAVKELSIARVRDWKTVDLFRRAATVLAGLHHPGVPKLVDSFEVERSGITFYYLVVELIDGENLAARLHKGHVHAEQDAREVLRRLLEILDYLHGGSPPIVHRDLKPSNVMRRNDGRYVLIDFDIVQDMLRPQGGSTIAVGTPGYAPLEQYVGLSSPASDVHALGATIVALLTGRDPTELMEPGTHRIDFRSRTTVSDGFGRLLDRMLAPNAADRYASAAEVVAALDELERTEREQARRVVRAAPARRKWRSVLLGLVPTLLILGLGVRTVLSHNLRSCQAEASSAPVPPSAVAGLKAGESRRIRPDGIAGSLAAFDPVANLPWVTDLARRWAPDVRLVHLLEVKHVRADGTMDVVSDAEAGVTYHFESPSRIAAADRSYAAWVEVRAGAIEFRIGFASDGTPSALDPIPAPRCGFKAAFDNLRRMGVLPERPHYDANLLGVVRWEDFGHTGEGSWHIDAPSNDAEIPRISTVTCRPLAWDGTEADPGFSRPVHRRGRVAAAEGSSPVEADVPCRFDVVASWKPGTNCEVEVACGPAGSESYLWSEAQTCSVVDDTPVPADDRRGTIEDGDGRLEFDPTGNRVVVSDTGPGAYSVTIALE